MINDIHVDWNFFPGLVIRHDDQLLAAPVGTVMQYREDGLPISLYVRKDSGWVSGDQELIPNEDIIGYFDLTGRNSIVSVPDQGEKVEEGCDNPVKVKEEFVPKFPNDPDNPNKETPRGDVLREAEFLITGDRNITYGSPVENFRNIGEIWTTLLKHKLKPGQRVTGTNVADLMSAVKLARNVAQPKRDNFVDLAGYAACGYEAFLAEQDED